jgi:hypothetical protein
VHLILDAILEVLPNDAVCKMNHIANDELQIVAGASQSRLDELTADRNATVIDIAAVKGAA